MFRLFHGKHPLFSSVVTALTIMLLFAAFSGCATQGDVEALHQRILYLEQRNKDLEKKNALALEKNEKVRQLIENYNKEYSEEGQKIRFQSAELRTTFEKIQNRIADLNGKIEETDHRLASIADNSETYRKKTEGRLEKLEQYLNLEAPVVSGGPGVVRRPPPDEVRPPETATESVPPSALVDSGAVKPGGQGQGETVFSEDELYALAKQAFDQNDFKSAREGFQTLIKQYPDSKYADNAQFYFGEMFFRQKKYRKAILEYQTVIEKYPTGNKVRNALLKQGFSFFNLGDKQSARMILEELIAKFPDSNEANIARRKLDTF